jgi:hypothetical protein
MLVEARPLSRQSCGCDATFISWQGGNICSGLPLLEGGTQLLVAASDAEMAMSCVQAFPVVPSRKVYNARASEWSRRE